jgi:hypothetical protein
MSESESDSENEPEFELYHLEKDLLFEYNKIMHLKIFVDSSDNELKKNTKKLSINII